MSKDITGRNPRNKATIMLRNIPMKLDDYQANPKREREIK